MRGCSRLRRIPTIPFILGMLAFFAAVGPRSLIPGNIAWLERGDPAWHYLGWEFYRRSPWSSPLGRNENYGLELKTSIVTSDSNALFALALKPFNEILPEPFQYLGYWILLCFLLQAWFAWQLVGLVTDDQFIRPLATGLFVFAPPMLWRLNGHFNLVAHFLILAALYLAIGPPRKRKALVWSTLLVVATLVHVYLLAMVLVIWIADLAWSTHNDSSILITVKDFSLGILVVGLASWQSGYFVAVTGVSTSRYGHFRMNILAPLDSSGWSHVVPDIPESAGDYEGFNYLGIGVVLLGLAAASVLARKNVKVKSIISVQPFLFLGLLALTLFSLTHQVGLGTVDFRYPLPDSILYIFGIFQSSGRMFWPVLYVLMLTIVWLVVRGYSPRRARIFVAIAVAMQIVDTSAGWTDVRARLMVEPAEEWESRLQDPFWDQAAQQYEQVRILLPRSGHPDWQTFADYAVQNDLATDAILVARIDGSALELAREAAEERIASGTYEADTLYIVDADHVLAVAESLSGQGDRLAHIDGYHVVAPRWDRSCDSRQP